MVCCRPCFLCAHTLTSAVWQAHRIVPSSPRYSIVIYLVKRCRDIVNIFKYKLASFPPNHPLANTIFLLWVNKTDGPYTLSPTTTNASTTGRNKRNSHKRFSNLLSLFLLRSNSIEIAMQNMFIHKVLVQR